jgi:hypothetical protein
MQIDGFSYEVIQELNTLRTNPKVYAQYLDEEKQYFTGNVLKLPGENANLRTQEGPAAYDEAINFLMNVKAVPPIDMHTSLFKIANDYINDARQVSYEQLDTLDIDKYIQKYGNFSGKFSRMMDFGGTTPRRVITNLVTCDGDQTRGYRLSLFSKDFKFIGVASGPYPTYNRFTILINCTKFTSHDPNNDIPILVKGSTSKTTTTTTTTTKSTTVNDGPQLIGKTTKLRSTNKPAGFPSSSNDDNEPEEEDLMEEGVKSVKKTEKIETINGKQYRIIKKTKFMQDGSTETETIKEQI